MTIYNFNNGPNNEGYILRPNIGSEPDRIRENQIARHYQIESIDYESGQVTWGSGVGEPYVMVSNTSTTYIDNVYSANSNPYSIPSRFTYLGGKPKTSYYRGKIVPIPIEYTPTVDMTGYIVDLVTVSFFADASGTTPLAVPIAYDALGDPVIISTQSFFMNISPESAIVAGTMAHGTMLNPYGSTSSGQGFDEILENVSAGGQSASFNDYISGLNVDPGNTSALIEVTTGSEASYVKSVRDLGISLPDSWQSFDQYEVITILGSVPLAGFLRPSPSSTSKTILATSSTLSRSIIPNLASVAGQITESEALTNTMPMMPMWGFGAEQLRRLTIEKEDGGGSSSNYMGDIAISRGEGLLRLCIGTTTWSSNRQTLFLRSVRNGLDFYGTYERGWRGAVGAGQHNGYVSYMFLAALATGNMSVLAAAQNVSTNSRNQPSWVTSSEVDYGVGFPTSGAGDVIRYNQPYFTEHVGTVHGEQGSKKAFDVLASSEQGQRYLSVAAIGNILEVLATTSFVGGLDAWLTGGAKDNTNEFAAAIAFADKYLSTFADYGGRTFPTWTLQWYNDHRDSIDMSRYTSVPIQFDLGDDEEGANRLTPGDGSIAYDLSDIDWSNPVVTQRDVRYSTDGISFVEVLDVADSGTLTSLRKGTLHYFQERRHNSLGTGLWSNNFAYSAIRSARFQTTTTGTPAAATPVMIQAPAIYYKPYVAWLGPRYELAPETLTQDIAVLYCGAGYWTDGTFTYVWKRNGSPIGGATAQSYTLTSSDLSADIECEVTATNGTGSDSATTNDVTVFDNQILPSGTLIDTTFDASFGIFHEDVLASMVTNKVNCTISHEPTRYWNDLETSNGGVRGIKTGQFPKIDFEITGLTIGLEYNVLIHSLVEADGVAWNVNGLWRLGTTVTGQEYANGTVVYDSTAGAQPTLGIVDETFTATATSLWIRINNPTTTGGSGLGNPAISRLRVRET